MEQDFLKEEYRKYLENLFVIEHKVDLRVILKEYINKGYSLKMLKDDYAFLEEPKVEGALGVFGQKCAVVNPKGEIITDFYYNCCPKAIEVFNNNKNKNYFPIYCGKGIGGYDLYTVINSSGKEVLGRFYKVNCNGPLIIATKKIDFDFEVFSGAFDMFLIDYSGNICSDGEYEVIEEFCDGIARVSNRKYSTTCNVEQFWFINENGEKVFSKGYNRASDFSCGLALVTEAYTNKNKIINTNGEDVFCFSDYFNEYYSISPYETFINGIAKVDVVKYRISQDMLKYFQNKIGYVDVNGDSIPLDKVLENRGFRCIKSLFGFVCFDKQRRKYKLKYQPIHEFDNYFICFDGNNLYAYDKNLQTYQILCNEFLEDGIINFGDNILNYKNALYFFGNQIIDLGEAGYCYDQLLSVSETDKNISVLTFEEFVSKYKNDPDWQKKMAEQIRNLEKRNLNLKLKEEQSKKEELERKLKNDLKEKLSKIGSITREIESLQDNFSRSKTFENVERIRSVSEDVLFDIVDGHKVFKEVFKSQATLQFLDLSLISFDNVDVSGIDLSYTNAQINPQTVYRKNMSNSSFRGMQFISGDFSGVDIRNSDFSECNLDFALLDNAIKDDTTIFSEDVIKNM